MGMGFERSYWRILLAAEVQPYSKMFLFYISEGFPWIPSSRPSPIPKELSSVEYKHTVCVLFDIPKTVVTLH